MIANHGEEEQRTGIVRNEISTTAKVRLRLLKSPPPQHHAHITRSQSTTWHGMAWRVNHGLYLLLQLCEECCGASQLRGLLRGRGHPGVGPTGRVRAQAASSSLLLRRMVQRQEVSLLRGSISRAQEPCSSSAGNHRPLLARRNQGTSLDPQTAGHRGGMPASGNQQETWDG